MKAAQWLLRNIRVIQRAREPVTHQAFPPLLVGVKVGAGLEGLDSTLGSLLATANIFLCFWDSLVGTGECLMLVLPLQMVRGGKQQSKV